ncbi:MAG: HD domain-containing protein [Oligoflexia bacterium]|nr:HD domain-containing protein [Oligoflexia bacterium]
MSSHPAKKAENPSQLTPDPQAAQLLDALGKIRGIEGEISQVILEMQEKVQQLEYLNDFSSLLNSTLETETVREKALEATCRLLRCETASLFLVDSAKAELYWETALGEVGRELKKSVRLPIDDRSIAGYVAMTGESLLINDVSSDPRHNRKAGARGAFRSRTMLCVPLKTKGRVIGVLQAINKLPGTSSRVSRHRWPCFQGADQRLLQSLSDQVAIAVENSRLYTELKESFFGTVEALAEAIEKKDKYTGGHTKRVVHYSLCIARHLEVEGAPVSAEQLERIRLGAVLHDVGKIGVEDKVLKKQSQLDDQEWKLMKTHPELGYDIMSRVPGLRDVIGGMRYHHERWDGKGYPLGLKAEEIPLIARIIAVADTYDAMVSTRPYRKGLDPKVAYDEIVRHRGTQFDPKIVDAFIEAFKNEKMGKGSGGSRLSNMD